ncbi:hypothetical protein FA09DRAFT_120426 [Tilletiopsis washingtonensis]|uniref:Uncharacterized protein n=1 Tax=Tilletiopsis washingtonensis TaxID=58919 RepID=A0A316ZKN4_9BASI|nr:hypothetical protein FA09DRAFT_120426 [Tilletiopsis washingtonensis]PWO00946.1 hypothetical protein FA09DRAFT_120426 [Tilletiopsis washingtonensis]
MPSQQTGADLSVNHAATHSGLRMCSCSAAGLLCACSRMERMTGSARMPATSGSLCLGVCRHGAGKVALLVQVVSAIPLLLALGGVDVGAPLVLLELLLGRLQLGERVGGAVLRQALLEEADRRRQVLLLHVGRADARIRLGHDLVVGARLAAVLQRLLARLDALVVRARLELARCQVREVHDVLVRLPRRLVLLRGTGKVALHVQRVAARLCCVAGLLRLRLFAVLLLRRLRLRLGRLGRRLGCRLGRLLLARARVAGHGAGALGALKRLQVDAHQHAHDGNHVGVREGRRRLARVRLDGRELGTERRVAHQRRRLGVRLELAPHLRVLEHLADAHAGVVVGCCAGVSAATMQHQGKCHSPSADCTLSRPRCRMASPGATFRPSSYAATASSSRPRPCSAAPLRAKPLPNVGLASMVCATGCQRLAPGAQQRSASQASGSTTASKLYSARTLSPSSSARSQSLSAA